MSPTLDERLERLRLGNQRFCSGQTTAHSSLTAARLETVSGTRRPWLVVLGCMDARVPVEQVFDLELGEAVVLRSPGCLVGDACAAGMELAAQALQPELVVVLGHGDNLAVKGAMENATPDAQVLARAYHRMLPDIRSLGLQGQGAEAVRAAVHAVTAGAARDLQKRSPTLAERVQQGTTALRQAFYDVETGRVDWITPQQDQSGP